MEKLTIYETEYTPLVNFDPQQGVIEMSGNSNPANSLRFYRKVMMGLEEYAVKENKGLTANLHFSYFNSSSSKCLYDILKMLNAMERQGRSVTINWYYTEQDNDMKEVGQDFSDILNLKFNFIKGTA